MIYSRRIEKGILSIIDLWRSANHQPQVQNVRVLFPASEIHVFLCSVRWDRDKAIEYLQNITAKTRPFIEVEVDRYITWPGQACAYKIGELTIQDLKKLAMDKLGEEGLWISRTTTPSIL